MKDNSPSHPSWLERLGHALSREPQDRKQLIELLHDAKERQLLDAEALKMIEGVMNVSEMKVRDIMIPRAQMITVDEDTHPKTAIPSIIKSAHSRFPITKKNSEQVIGILLAKDLLKYTCHQGENIKIGELARPATLIPESKRLDVLLKEFRLNRHHMAIVVDEYGGVAGLVTIEDVLEQIVGDIIDEYDPEEQEPNIKSLNHGEYIVKALTSLEEFNQYFNTHYEQESCDTISGLILHLVGHLPKSGEVITLDGYKVTIMKASARGIKLLKIKNVSPKP